MRIGDASIMPSIPAAHTNIPTIAIAEKLSDIIKSDHGYINKTEYHSEEPPEEPFSPDFGLSLENELFETNDTIKIEFGR